MSDHIDAKDNEQDSRISYLESKIESYREKIYGMQIKLDTLVCGEDLDRLYSYIDKLEVKVKELDSELRGRIRKTEIWIGGAGAVIAAATTIIGFVLAADARPAHAFVEDGLVEQPCPLSLVKTSFASNDQVVVKELVNGSNDTTKSEELL
jgi:hypothetical protein